MIVTIDPGHGGTTKVGGSSANNATGANGTLEKDVVLDLGLRLRDLLVARGQSVQLTRDGDFNLGLRERARVARDNDADLFLSIHLNGFHDASVQGTEAWIHEQHNESSKVFADLVQARVLDATAYRDRGVKTARFGVLNPAHHLEKTAACLAEISFLTDPQEEERLRSDDYRDAIAAALMEAVLDYEARAPREALVAATAGTGVESGPEAPRGSPDTSKA